MAYYDLAVTYERQLVLQQKEAIRNSDTNIIEARKLQLLAINAYRRAIVHDDSNWKPFTSLGHLLTVVDNSNRTTLSEAQTLLQKANAVNPGQTVVINQLVTVLNWLHNKEAAAAVMQTAVQQGVYVQVRHLNHVQAPTTLCCCHHVACQKVVNFMNDLHRSGNTLHK